jgi:epoxyqueuosine reductase QueG
MSLDELGTISDEEFREKTRGSAIRRAKPEGMRRNAALAQRVSK